MRYQFEWLKTTIIISIGMHLNSNLKIVLFCSLSLAREHTHNLYETDATTATNKQITMIGIQFLIDKDRSIKICVHGVQRVQCVQSL